MLRPYFEEGFPRPGMSERLGPTAAEDDDDSTHRRPC